MSATWQSLEEHLDGLRESVDNSIEKSLPTRGQPPAVAIAPRLLLLVVLVALVELHTACQQLRGLYPPV